MESKKEKVEYTCICVYIYMKYIVGSGSHGQGGSRSKITNVVAVVASMTKSRDLMYSLKGIVNLCDILKTCYT